MRSVRETIAFGLGLLAALFAIAQCEGCAHPKEASFPAYCYDEQEFRKELVGCVSLATDKELSRECRRLVHASCGFVMTSSASTGLP